MLHLYFMRKISLLKEWVGGNGRHIMPYLYDLPEIKEVTH